MGHLQIFKAVTVLNSPVQMYPKRDDNAIIYRSTDTFLPSDSVRY